MPPKGRSGGKSNELKVAKRGNQKAGPPAPAPGQKEAPKAAESKQELRSEPKQEPRSEPKQELQNEPIERRAGSGSSTRKVSDGLKQLPQAAYSFVRESYLMLDSDGSGSVSKVTMRDMLASLGFRDDGDKRLNAMLERTGEPITFGSYLAVMGELLGDLPTREELDMMVEAFQRKDGSVDERDLRDALGDEGLTPAEIDSVIERFSKPTRQGRSFDVKQFASAMSI